MHLIDAIRFRKIQVIKLSNRGLRTKQIVDHINDANPTKFSISPSAYLQNFYTKKLKTQISK
jgi:hypothetical protein